MKKPYTLTLLSSKEKAGMTVVQVKTVDTYDTRRYVVAKTVFQGYMQLFEWYLRRHPNMKYEDRNNISRIITYSVPGARAWRDYMPGGFATHYTYQAKRQRMKNGVKIDLITARFFRYNVDGYGLRSRSYILSWLVEEWSRASEKELRWLSIAGGAGQPMYDALKQLPEATQKNAHFTLVDIDDDVLAFAEEVYKEQDLAIASATFSHANMFDYTTAAGVLDDTRPNVVDAMGIFEYADVNQARDLVSAVYAALPRGGMFVFTNMAHDRPHLNVHKRMIGWPGVIPRRVEEVADILKTAGVPLSDVTAYQPSDGVYNIFKVMKL